MLGAQTPTGQLHRAEWRLDTDAETLSRRVWTTLTPAGTDALQPENVVLTGIDGLRIRSYWSGIGWIDGPINPVLQDRSAPEPENEDRVGPAPENYSDFVPLAIEVTLATAAWGDITLIESLK